MAEGEELYALPRTVLRVLASVSPAVGSEQRVWRAVCRRLTCDAFGDTGFSDPNDHDRALRDARMWFRHFPEEVETVFNLADVPDWQVIRQEVIQHDASYRYDEQPT